MKRIAKNQIMNQYLEKLLGCDLINMSNQAKQDFLRWLKDDLETINDKISVVETVFKLNKPKPFEIYQLMSNVADILGDNYWDENAYELDEAKHYIEIITDCLIALIYVDKQDGNIYLRPTLSVYGENIFLGRIKVFDERVRLY